MTERALNGFGWIRGEVVIRTTGHVVNQYCKRVEQKYWLDASLAVLNEVWVGKILGRKQRQEWGMKGVFVNQSTLETDLVVETRCGKRIYILRRDEDVLYILTVLTSVLFDADENPERGPRWEPRKIAKGHVGQRRRRRTG